MILVLSSSLFLLFPFCFCSLLQLSTSNFFPLRGQFEGYNLTRVHKLMEKGIMEENLEKSGLLENFVKYRDWKFAQRWKVFSSFVWCGAKKHVKLFPFNSQYYNYGLFNTVLNICIVMKLIWQLFVVLVSVARVFATFFLFVSFNHFILVPRPNLSFEAQLIAGKSHDLESISCPEQPNPPAVLSAITHGTQKHNAELKYPQRISRLDIIMEVVPKKKES